MKYLLRACILSCLIVLTLTIVIQAEIDYAVKLATEEFTPQTITDAFDKSTQLVNKHILIQFEQPIDEFTREQLKDEGIEILEYVPNLTFTARLNKPIDQNVLDQYGIRWLDKIQPVNKISPLLSETGIGEWARRGSDRVQFVLLFHKDEDINFWADKLRDEYNAEIIGLEPSSNAIDLILPEMAYYRLSELDAVIWVKQVNPPQMIDNNIARQSTGAEVLQASPYDLDGSGIVFAEWDGGLVDRDHPDLTGRVTHLSSSSLHYHATHVAGTMMGNGTNSGGLYRGMAPAATLLSFEWWGSASEAISEYGMAQLSYGATIANNSWGLGVGDPATQSACNNIMGNYLSENTTIDNIVNSYHGQPIVICWSAGNQRSTASDYCGSLGWTYNTVSGYANSKNIITVGAVVSSSDEMTSFSSWGPCDDGRLKPDVVGPGQALTSTNVGGGYLTLQGTSMSSPAVAGTIALIQEQGEISFPGRVFLSSTIKGIVINTAIDLGANGPDYQFGHGKIDGVKAVNKIKDGDSSYVEADISTGEVHLYDLTVPGDVDELRVTLVWDDPGATVLSGPNLINDLDLVLIDPFSGEEYPWVLDPDNPSYAATTGADHLNNVESITIDNPTAGLWKARVTGYNIPDGPQSYSLAFTPDAINTPGNLTAMAVYASEDVTIDPGLSTDVEFYVSNVGASADSIDVTIDDYVGWLDDPAVDTTVYLNPYDSVYFSLSVTVPSEAMAWEYDSVTCTMTSKSNPEVTTSGNTVVSSGAYYQFSLTPLDNDSVASPEEYEFDVTVKNNGNNYDDFKITPYDELGWNIIPGYKWVYDITPGDSTTITFTISVLPEEIHLTNNQVTIDAFSNGGAINQTSFVLTVKNPYPPPSLYSPDDNFYTNDRSTSFSWEENGDSYNLYIATDENMTGIERLYTGISIGSFTMPEADSLDDGGYYWAVRRYVGADSSSLQRYPRKVIIDNTPPVPANATSPIDGAYIGQPNFLFYFTSSGKGTADEKAPEFFCIQVCQDSSFTEEILTYAPINGISFQMPDILDPGRWYWHIRTEDSAGNVSEYSEKEYFILDTETPSVPTQLIPINGGSAGGSGATMKWSTDDPPPYEESPEFYYLQVSINSSFSNLVFAGDVYETTYSVPAENFTEGNYYWWRLRGKDEVGHSSAYQSSPFSFQFLGFICGDVNMSGGVNISDITFLVGYLFGGGPAPDPIEAGSVNGDPNINISDITYLVGYLFGGGPAPVCY